MRLTFGGMLFDSDARQLVRGAAPIALSPKAFDLLAYLIENRPNALSKDVLHERLWPGVFVSDTNLAGLIADIRRALGDDARTPRYVRTVQRYGYAFAGTAEPAKGSSVALERSRDTNQGTGSWGRCWLAHGSRQIPLADGENILGRDESGGPLASNSISRRHAKITVDGAIASIEDLGSKNGTFLRGRLIKCPERLVDGDAIAFGSVDLVFRTPSADRSTRTWKKKRSREPV